MACFGATELTRTGLFLLHLLRCLPQFLIARRIQGFTSTARKKKRCTHESTMRFSICTLLGLARKLIFRGLCDDEPRSNRLARK